MDNRYPAWLIDRVAWAIYLAGDDPYDRTEEAVAVLDALGFAPSYQAFKRAGRVRADTDTWGTEVVSPEVREEYMRVSDELGEEG